MGVYSINIVGESKYQTAIRRCREGEAIRLRKEANNPHDRNAVAVECPRGATLGYLPRDCFLQRLIWDENKPLSAQIERLKRAPGTSTTGVILEVATTGVMVDSVYDGIYRAPQKPRQLARHHHARKRSALSRLFKLF